MNASVRIGVFGDYNPDSRAHTATGEAIGHAAARLGIQAEVEWIPTPELDQSVETRLDRFDALWCAPGSPYRSMHGALEGIRFARTARVPFIGTCAGFQHVVIEYARNVLGFQDAHHAEYDPYASRLFVHELACSLLGQTMTIRLRQPSRAFQVYQRSEIAEQYYCKFGVNPAYQPLLEDGGLCVAGVDDAGEARIVELPDHPFFIATLFVPQLTSTAEEPHPLILAYARHAAGQCEIT